MPEGPGKRTRRLFFAIWPDGDTRAALVRTTRRAVRRCGGRPVPPRNYHITLAFLGNQPAELFDDIVAAGSAVSAAPVELVLDRFGYFAKPRVFWLGATEGPPALAALSRDLWDRLEALGIRRESRPFHAHLTLARKVAALPEVRAPEPVTWRVASFALVESNTDPLGALYSVAREFALRAS